MISTLVQTGKHVVRFRKKRTASFFVSLDITQPIAQKEF